MARDSIRCSFCGKKQEQVGRIIAGPNVYICNECVELCSSILHDEMHNGLNEQQLELPHGLVKVPHYKAHLHELGFGKAVVHNNHSMSQIIFHTLGLPSSSRSIPDRPSMFLFQASRMSRCCS